MSTAEEAEILLVEDNPNDVELTLRALRKQNLESKVFVVRDGAEALDFLFASGTYNKRKIDDHQPSKQLALHYPSASPLPPLILAT